MGLVADLVTLVKTKKSAVSPQAPIRHNKAMNASPMAVRKLFVGLISLGCLITAVICCLYTHWTNPVVSVTSRLGLMLGALWLALPSQGDNIAWQKAFPIALAVIVVLAFFKRGGGRMMLFVVPIAIVVGIAAAFIRPRPRRRPPGSR
jgi:hypothetical protein